jgi:hypothetical protein
MTATRQGRVRVQAARSAARARRQAAWAAPPGRPTLARTRIATTGRSALLEGSVGDHADRPLGQEPIRHLLEFGPSGPGQAGAQGDQNVLAGEGGRGRGQPVRASQPIEQPTGHRIGHRPALIPVGCPAGHLPDKASVSCPRSAASVRHRSFRVSGGSCCLGLRVAWTVHLTSRGVRSRPSPTSRSSSASI